MEHAFASLTTFRQDAMMPAMVGNANVVSTCAPNQGARKRTASSAFGSFHEKLSAKRAGKSALHLFVVEFSKALVA